MDWSQCLYIGALALALGTGRPHWIVASAMTFNLVATILLAADPISVAVTDLLTAGLLIGEGRRANVAALIYLAMLPIYLAGHYLGLNGAVIYALIDVLAYVQLAAIGGWDVGLRNLYRRARRHRAGRELRPDIAAASRRHVSRDQGRSA